MRVLDLTGKKFNRLTVIEKHGKKNGSITWLCKCDCGNMTITTGNYIKSGHTKSCGCLIAEKVREVNKKNIIGRRNGQLEIIKELGSSKVIVKCDCGNTKEIHLSNLRKTKSCGCLRGETPTKLKQVWDSAKQRCNNPNSHAYKDYGLRGIKVCEEWSEYPSFKVWAVNNGYVEDQGLTLDRIDNNLGYSPENCRWVDQKTQIRNRRNTFYVEFEGAKVTLGELSDRYNINIRTLKTRYRKGLRGTDLTKEVRGKWKQVNQS